MSSKSKKNTVVVRDAKYIVWWHALDRSVERGLMERGRRRNMSDFLVDIYEDNSESIDTRLVFEDFIYISIQEVDGEGITPLIMPIRTLHNNQEIWISTIWTTEIYMDMVKNSIRKYDKNKYVHDLMLQEAY